MHTVLHLNFSQLTKYIEHGCVSVNGELKFYTGVLPRSTQQDGAEERVLWNLRKKKINIKSTNGTAILLYDTILIPNQEPEIYRKTFSLFYLVKRSF